MASTCVGRYELLREVGRGDIAVVYFARQTELDRFVALKALSAWDPSFSRRFLRESQLAGALSHPNVVTVLEHFEHEGAPYIAMEYFERGSLRPYVGRMNLAQIGGVLEGLLAGLTHAESHGIVHRDLKPENLMVTADGRVKIADFGIAKATTTHTDAVLTVTGVTAGTPAYMAPEQAMAQDIGPWTDLYSVGCMAFELFTGNVPFHDSDAPIEILLRQANEPIPPVKSLRPEVDARISDWIERLLVKDPRQRTQHAGEAWRELEEILIGLLGPLWRREARLVADGAADTPPAPQPAPAGGRRRWIVPAALAGCAAAAASAAAIALSEPPTASGTRKAEAIVTLFAAGIAVEVPARWLEEPAAAPLVPGLDAGLAAGDALVVGKADKTAFNATLLPEGLRTKQNARATAIGGDAQALRYDGVAIGGRSSTVYSVPTTEGVATLACFAQAETCSRVASSLRITDGIVFPLGADATFLEAVERILRRLESRERAAAARLDEPATRLAATKQLWWAYAGASKALRKLKVSPADSELRMQMAEALFEAGCAYGRAAAHAARNDRAGYRREARLALAQQTTMTAALDGLADAGYELPSGAARAAAFPRLPALVESEPSAA